jgi:transcriptional regulator with XRE-family HTH domain
MPLLPGDDAAMSSAVSTLAVLSANLKALMAASQDLNSQSALGRRCKIDQRTVGRIVLMQHSPTLRQLDKLAKAFQLSPWQLLVPNLAPTNPPMLAVESESLKAMLHNITTTKVAIEGYLRDEGNTRPGGLD